MQLNPSVRRVTEIALLARQIEIQTAETGLRGGGPSPGHDSRQFLEPAQGSPQDERLRAALESLGDDELTDLVALAWLGRGDFATETWSDAREMARARFSDTDPIEYLIGTPMLAEYLEEGLSRLEYNVSGLETDMRRRGESRRLRVAPM